MLGSIIPFIYIYIYISGYTSSCVETIERLYNNGWILKEEGTMFSIIK